MLGKGKAAAAAGKGAAKTTLSFSSLFSLLQNSAVTLCRLQLGRRRRPSFRASAAAAAAAQKPRRCLYSARTGIYNGKREGASS